LPGTSATFTWDDGGTPIEDVAVWFGTTAGGGSGPTTTAGSGSEGGVIRLGFSAWPGWFPWQVAEEAGLFEAAGLDVELTYFESYTDSLNALNAGRLDANSQTLNDTISSVAAGSEQVIVLANDNSTGNDQIIVRPGIDTIADLRGKSIGIEEGTVDHFLLLLGLRDAGLSPDDVNIQPLLTDAAAAAFAAGQLDAVGAFAPFTTVALGREGSRPLFTSADYPGAIPDHLVVSREMVDERPGDVLRLVEVWFETLEYIRANADEAILAMAERAGVTVGDYLEYDGGTTIFSLADNIEAFGTGSDMSALGFAAESVAAFLVESGLIPRAPDLDGLLDPQFVQALAARP